MSSSPWSSLVKSKESWKRSINDNRKRNDSERKLDTSQRSKGEKSMSNEVETLVLQRGCSSRRSKGEPIVDHRKISIGRGDKARHGGAGLESQYCRG